MIDIVKTQKELAAIRGVSGREGGIAHALADIARPLADECTVDTLGNLIVRKKGSGARLMLSAHMDTIGLMATHIDKKGFVRFAAVGGHTPQELLFIPVIFENGARGVVAHDEKVELKNLKIPDLYIDLGCENHEDAAALVKTGEMASFVGDTYALDRRIVSPYLDNRIGCVTLLMVLDMLDRPTNDVYFVFSAQEEVGLRGARTASYGIDPQYALAVDVTGTGDVPENKVPMDCALGEGVAVKIMDSSIICHPAMVSRLEKVAGEIGVKVQREVLIRGGTDAGAIHISRGGVCSGGLSIPTRYIHSPSEMADTRDVEAAARLIVAMCNQKLDF